MSLKAAPRRDVVEVIRSGDWGEVSYSHRLSCGHTETRKRPAKAPVMACSSCLLAKNHVPAPQLLIDVMSAPDVMDIFYDPIAAEIAYVEGEAGRIRAGLANRFGVSHEAVDVVVGQMEDGMGVMSAVVFLDAAQARRLSAGA